MKEKEPGFVSASAKAGIVWGQPFTYDYILVFRTFGVWAL
jgi:hypothetical protein